MKRKTKVRRSRDVPAPDISETSETALEHFSAPTRPGRSSIERVDERRTDSIESVPIAGPQDGVAGFIEPDGSNAESAGSP